MPLRLLTVIFNIRAFTSTSVASLKNSTSPREGHALHHNAVCVLWPLNRSQDNISSAATGRSIQSPAAFKHRRPVSRAAVDYDTPAGYNNLKQSPALM